MTTSTKAPLTIYSAIATAVCQRIKDTVEGSNPKIFPDNPTRSTAPAAMEMQFVAVEAGSFSGEGHYGMMAEQITIRVTCQTKSLRGPAGAERMVSNIITNLFGFEPLPSCEALTPRNWQIQQLQTESQMWRYFALFNTTLERYAGQEPGIDEGITEVFAGVDIFALPDPAELIWTQDTTVS